MDESQYHIVTPQGNWTNWESAHIRGSPATHAVAENDPKRTLCGRDPDGWLWQNAVDPEISLANVSCRQCLHQLAKRDAREDKDR